MRAAGQEPAVCFVPWFDGHNNPRYVELFPRLNGTVRFLKVPLGGRRLVRSAAFRTWHCLKERVIYPAVLPRLAQRYGVLFTVDASQAAVWPRADSVVVDIDDAVFSERELGLLCTPQVRALVVTTTRARDVFLSLGLKKPIHVIPQGVSLDSLDREHATAIARQHKAPGTIVAGYHAPELTLSSDGAGRARDGLDDLDFLFEEWEAARAGCPRLELWLIGRPSRSVRSYAASRSWIRLWGYVPFVQMLDYAACFDLALYPRTYALPPGRFSVKIAQCLALGVPVVSTPVDESQTLRESGGGIVAGRGNFSEAIIGLAGSAERRGRLGEAGRTYAARELAWPALLARYREILQ